MLVIFFPWAFRKQALRAHIYHFLLIIVRHRYWLAQILIHFWSLESGLNKILRILFAFRNNGNFRIRREKFTLLFADGPVLLQGLFLCCKLLSRWLKCFFVGRGLRFLGILLRNHLEDTIMHGAWKVAQGWRLRFLLHKVSLLEDLLILWWLLDVYVPVWLVHSRHLELLRARQLREGIIAERAQDEFVTVCCERSWLWLGLSSLNVFGRGGGSLALAVTNGCLSRWIVPWRVLTRRHLRDEVSNALDLAVVSLLICVYEILQMVHIAS